MGEENREGADDPVAKRVRCPSCNEMAFAIVPAGVAIAEDEEGADGKVWVNCGECSNQFLVYYRNDT